MENLTKEQLVDLARQLRKAEETLSDYIFDHYAGMTLDQYNELSQRQQDISKTIQSLLTQAVVVEVEDADKTIKHLNGVLGRINRTVRRVEDTHRVLAMATCMMTLCSSLLSRNPAAIARALIGLSELADDKPA